jgi:hypothetical protein
MKGQAYRKYYRQIAYRIVPIQEISQIMEICIKKVEIFEDKEETYICYYADYEEQPFSASFKFAHGYPDEIIYHDRDCQYQDIGRYKGHIKHAAACQQ